MEPFNYFRLPGHSVPGFDLTTLARSVFLNRDYLIEVVAYNDYTWSIPPEAESFFLLLPRSGAETDYYLGCYPPVREDGAARLEWLDLVFGIVEINLIAL